MLDATGLDLPFRLTRADRPTEIGDLWQIGQHRLMCGDATDPAHVAQLTQGQPADLVFTSPPYAQQRHYTQRIADWDHLMQGMSRSLPTHDRTQVIVNLGLVHRDCEWQDYWHEWIEYMRDLGWRRFGWYIWDKRNALPGDWAGRLAPAHEFLFHFNRTARKPNKTKPKKPAYIRYNTNAGVLRRADGSISTVSSREASLATHKIPDSVIRLEAEKRNSARKHPAVFPVELACEIITAYSDPQESIFDPFAGSGSTIIAADRHDRIGYGMEIAPAYCDIAIERIMRETGLHADRLPR
jgi:DNA modification methylase